jgi:hypothetical protein
MRRYYFELVNPGPGEVGTIDTTKESDEIEEYLKQWYSNDLLCVYHESDTEDGISFIIDYQKEDQCV